MVGCKQCGRCCKRVTFWEICSPNEWKIIYDILMKRYDGLVDVHIPYRGMVTFDISGSINKNALEKGNENLYWLLDEFNCLFLKKVRDDRGRFKGKYSCEFHGTEAKPKGCREFPLKHSRKEAEEFCGCIYFKK